MMRIKIQKLCRTESFILFVITGMGVVLRLFAFQFNDLPHGDIHLDYAAGWGFFTTGKLVLPIIAIRPYLYDQLKGGIPLDQHAPLWPIMGGLMAKITGDVYVAFKWLSLIAGISLIPASYFAFQRVFQNQQPALFTSICVALSYVLIDFSGNGSLYMVNALFYLLLLFFFKSDQILNSALVGVLLGLLYLLNYQSVVAYLAIGAVYCSMWRSKDLSSLKITNLIVSLACSFLIVLPWLIRNQQIFGNPFYNVNMEFVWSNLGVPSKVTLIDHGIVREMIWEQFDFRTIPTKVAAWTLRNSVYFIGRTLVLAPFISLFIPNAILHFWRVSSKYNSAKLAGLMISLFIFLLMISCIWPVFQFRYFVPLLPLIFGIGGYGLFIRFQDSRWLKPFLGVCLILMVFIGLMTFLRVPSHTNYYDSNEFYRYRTGEADWQIDERSLIEAAHVIAPKLQSPVIGPPSLFYYLKHPIIFDNHVQDPEISSVLIQKYQVQYIVEQPNRESYYADFLEFEIIFRNPHYIVLEIHSP